MSQYTPNIISTIIKCLKRQVILLIGSYKVFHKNQDENASSRIYRRHHRDEANLCQTTVI
jgi:hypothetical protein